MMSAAKRVKEAVAKEAEVVQEAPKEAEVAQEAPKRAAPMKDCPECGARVAAATRVCECGHEFRAKGTRTKKSEHPLVLAVQLVKACGSLEQARALCDDPIVKLIEACGGRVKTEGLLTELEAVVGLMQSNDEVESPTAGELPIESDEPSIDELAAA